MISKMQFQFSEKLKATLAKTLRPLMKGFVMTSFGIGAGSGSSFAKSDPNASSESAVEKYLEKWLEKPLIVGASVSADRSTNSPGKRLALRYTKPADIKTIAIGGMPSIKVLPSVRAKDLQDRSIVIGLDLFFWDSTLASPAASIKALDKLLGDAKALNIPVVLGEVPELLPGMQPSRVAINEAIAKRCAALQHCYVMKFDALLKQVLTDGYLAVKGRKYTLQELVPDGLHLGAVAGEDLANRLAALLEQK